MLLAGLPCWLLVSPNLGFTTMSPATADRLVCNGSLRRLAPLILPGSIELGHEEIDPQRARWSSRSSALHFHQGKIRRPSCTIYVLCDTQVAVPATAALPCEQQRPPCRIRVSSAGVGAISAHHPRHHVLFTHPHGHFVGKAAQRTATVFTHKRAAFWTW